MFDGGGVIVRTERRRRYSDAEKAAIVAESLRPDVTVVSVARRHGIAKSLIYNWRANRCEAEAIARKTLEFIPCGQFVEAAADTSAPAIIPEGPEPSVGPLVAGVAASPPTEPPRAGTIAIELANGARLTVDNFVNEKALARVLRALKAVP
uniref:IS66-like element accessory protein TnpA n=1 Tax=Erythrobacter sp. CCH5-A1 TaxID=1768792 RepID=UPI0008321561